MAQFPLIESAALQSEMTERMKVTLDNNSAYAAFGNAGHIESFGRDIEDNVNWVTLTEDEQHLWHAFRREHDLSTNPEDFWKAVDAVQTYLGTVADA